MASIDPEAIGIPARTVRAIASAKEAEGKKKVVVGKKDLISKNTARIVAQADRYVFIA